MINANKAYLSSFFSQNLQFVVPFFQRPYVWNDENWEILWEHITKVSIQTKEHFIGTVITKQIPADKVGESKNELIDGQQRLTTISLFLKALEHTASGEGEFENLKNFIEKLLVFTDTRNNKYLRIEHSKNDKDYFEAVLLGTKLKELPNQNHNILACYRFYLKKLETLTDTKRDELLSILLEKVPVISMLLSAEDDEQEIFDTINSLGVRLTTGELLKNFIFKDRLLQPLFKEYWEDVFEDDDEQIQFWNRTKTSGRIYRTNIEILLYCYLIFKTGKEVKLESLFKEYKTWLSGQDMEQKKLVLEEVRQFASIYQSFPEGVALNEIAYTEEEKRFFHIIENLEITTIYPLILAIYHLVSETAERNRILKVLETYLVRRNVCRFTTKNYNNLFIQLLNRLKELDTINAEKLCEILNSFTEYTNRIPTDSEFQYAFSIEALNHSNAKEILFCISLYLINNTRSDISKLSSSSYSIEHVLPQKWQSHWNNPPLTPEESAKRGKKLKTLGNLTLTTRSLNSTMKNACWEKKKEALQQHSMLRITTNYLQLPEWNEEQIDKRADDLAKIALEIWSV